MTVVASELHDRTSSGASVRVTPLHGLLADLLLCLPLVAAFGWSASVSLAAAVGARTWMDGYVADLRDSGSGRVIARAWCVGILLSLTLFVVTGANPSTGESLLPVTIWALASTALSWLSAAARRRGLVARQRVAFIGSSEFQGRFLDAARQEPLGAFDVTHVVRADGSMDESRFGNVDLIVIDGEHLTGSAVTQIIRDLDRTQAEIYVIGSPELPADTRLWHLPAVRVRRRGNGSIQAAVKRGFDIAAAGAALVLLSPVLAIAGWLVSRETGGSVLFRQVRVGRNGEPFELLKLQTLRPENATESQTHWNIAQDDRLGPVGRFLRRTSIDELPQLINILRGDMTIVGPRPERPHFVEMFSQEYPHYPARHRMQVGLTGLAQVQGLRGDTSIDDRAAFDNLYIGSWSLASDLKIMALTVPAVLRGEGG